MHIVYILYSKKLNRFYIGYSSNFEQRFELHLNDTQTRKFTYNANDWLIHSTIDCTSKIQALAIEKHIKSMKSKVYIQNLLKYPEMITKLLEKHKASELWIRAPIAIGVGSSPPRQRSFKSLTEMLGFFYTFILIQRHAHCIYPLLKKTKSILYWLLF